MGSLAPTQQLENTTLTRWQRSFSSPSYSRAKPPRHTILHIGVGGFHRAHLALYMDRIRELPSIGGSSNPDEYDWGIIGVGLMEFDRGLRDALKKQDCLYTLVERTASSDKARVVGSIHDFILAVDDPAGLIELIAREDVKILSMTITENGYCFSEKTGDLDLTQTDIAWDISHAHEEHTAPRTVYGYMARGLELRRKLGRKPWTAMSCDNMQQNSALLKKMLLTFIRQSGKEDLAEWVEGSVGFVSSMVDRITPRTTDEERTLVKTKFGLNDAAPVVCEPFIDWVIQEDAFTNIRPPFEKVGANLVRDIEELEAFEMMKLRLLNCSHQCLAYLGYLSAYEHVSEVLVNPNFNKYLRGMMRNEVFPILDFMPRERLEAYSDMILQRFANSAIRDTLVRICRGASGCLPKFVLPTISDHIKRGSTNFDGLALCVAAWIRYVTGINELKRTFPVEDPMFGEFRRASLKGFKDPRPVLENRVVFPDELRNSKEFVAVLSKYLDTMYERGCKYTLKKFLDDRKDTYV